MHSKQQRDRYTRAPPQTLTLSQDVPSASPWQGCQSRWPRASPQRPPLLAPSARWRAQLGTEEARRSVGFAFSSAGMCWPPRAARGAGVGTMGPRGLRGPGGASRSGLPGPRPALLLPPLCAPGRLSFLEGPGGPQTARRPGASKAPCCCAPRPCDLSWGPVLLSAPNTDPAEPLEKTFHGATRTGPSARPVRNPRRYPR